MAWMPGAVRKEVRRHRTSIVGPRRLVLHTAVSAGSSLFGFFNRAGNPTSHFYVRADGTVEQYVDTRFRAPAQLGGNHDSISVETQDMGRPFPAWSGSNVPAWTGVQVDALARIAGWVHRTHGVPLSPLPNTRPGSRGVGYHRQGIAPWRVSGGETWSNARGKVCPGDRRVAQIPTIIARAKGMVDGSAPKPPAPPETRSWLDMASRQDLAEVIESRLNNTVVKHTEKNLAWHLRTLESRTANIRADQAVSLENQAAILARIGGESVGDIKAILEANHADYVARFEASEAREAAQLELIGAALSGERDAMDTLRALRDLLDTAVGDDDPDAGDGA